MTNLSAPFILRPVMTVLLTATAILFGVLAYRSLPVNDLPAVDYPVIQVQASYPGATPETMASTVATPLERQFMQISGLELITSSSTQGQARFVLQFDLSKSLAAAATDVQSAISRAGGQLPADLPSPPTFTTTNPNDQPILYIALTSDTVTAGDLYDYASTQVGQQISILSGVSQVTVIGSKAAVRIKADPSELAVRGLTIDGLVAAVQAGTSYQGAGQLDGPGKTYLLQPQGQLSTAEQYNNLIISAPNAAPVYLRDVATAVDSVQDERIDKRFWVRGVGIPAAQVTVAVYRQAGSNAVAVADAVKNMLPGMREQIPSSIQLTVVYDRSQTIVSSVSDVRQTLGIAFVLVVMVIFLFLGRLADTVIPVVALPLSLLITFIAMSVLGYSLDNLSLMAMTLAVGFLVDDAIVFLENTVRRMERGEGATAAALGSAREISFTIMAMTVSLAAVFLPLVFMGGLIGRIFREFAITIIVAILASGLVSLTLTPLMCARLLGRRGERKTLVERTAGAIERRVLSVYGRWLWFFVHHRWVSVVIWLACMAGTVYLFMAVPKAFLPAGDSSFIRGVMIAGEGSSPQAMSRHQDDVERVLHENPAVSTSLTVTSLSGTLGSNQGLVLAFLDPPQKRAPIGQVAAGLMEGIRESAPGVMAILQPNPVLQISTGATASQQGQYAYSISGTNPAEVYALSEQLLARLREFPGFATITSDLYNHTPGLKIHILREQARTYGISESRIVTLIRNAYAQNYVYLIKTPSDQYQVILEVADQDRRRPTDLSLLYVTSDDGLRTAPLSAVATWEEVLGPQAVNHINQFSSVTLFFNLKPDVPLGTATNFIETSAAQILPSYVRGSLQGEALTFRNTVESLAVLMLLAVFVMYVILGILYESYLHPITVLSSLPVALVGGLATLYLFGREASLYAYIGMFMLMGIVKKNGIMIVDFALHREAEGLTPADAIHEASMMRFRPIMMTTLAALMGAIPIALGYGADGASRQPLGLVIVGGLIVSQFITLFVTPAIYLYLEAFQRRVLNRVPFLRAERAGVATGPV